MAPIPNASFDPC